MNDRGSVTIWVLGLSILVLAFGGLALDMWRVIAVQRRTAAIADAAAVAAASGLDEVHYRATGEIVLDPARADLLAAQLVAAHDEEVTGVLVAVSPDGTRVTVEVSDEIVGGFVAFFSGDDGVLEVTASATAEPRVFP